MNATSNQRILVTGGAGFIGSNLIRHILAETEHEVLNVDSLTYAGNLASLEDVATSAKYEFERCDITDAEAIHRLLHRWKPTWVMHLAAESHVDRSIDGPGQFIQTNVIGTFNLLQAARSYWTSMEDKQRFRFHHVSTDEVYGSLGFEDEAFSEATPYDPHSPYSASKAASDHLVRAWFDTYQLPVVITNCSNNYGPYQFPEKLVPVVILKAISGQEIPVYGKGENVRDWLYVTDHAKALLSVVDKGTVGQTYNIGGNNERSNIELVRTMCGILDECHPIASNKELSDEQRQSLGSYADLITFVTDRPGHDLRYAIDASKIRDELGWEPEEDVKTGFEKTIRWYLDNRQWWSNILSGEYKLNRQGLAGS